MDVISRKGALAADLSHYFTGRPCKHDHIARRNKYGQCMECNRLKINTGKYKGGRKAYRKKHRAQDDGAELAKERAYREANPDRVVQWNKNRTPEKTREANRKCLEKIRSDPERYEKRLTKNRERACEWGRKNPEKKKEGDSLWKKNNRAYCNHKNRLREIGKTMRTPAWSDLDAIRFFYECCPQGCHVDHIIPLFGEKINGLHIAENLQWLPAKQNLIKNNSWPH